MALQQDPSITAHLEQLAVSGPEAEAGTADAGAEEDEEGDIDYDEVD